MRGNITKELGVIMTSNEQYLAELREKNKMSVAKINNQLQEIINLQQEIIAIMRGEK